MERTSTGPVSEELDGQSVCAVGFTTNQGLDVQATVLRLTPQLVAFEVYGPQNVLQLSEVLSNFKVLVGCRLAYSGKATISSLVNACPVTICEAVLSGALVEVDLFQLRHPRAELLAGFKKFLNGWQGFCRILPDYKLAVVGMQSFLHDLRLWLDQIELAIRALPSGDRNQVERNVVEELASCVSPVFSSLFEGFERVAGAVPPALAPAHYLFCRQQLHPLLLCSPFMYRITTKPLGYAGDYEMVDMILRDPFEGSSLFAKVLNIYILAQVPAIAHRNRVAYLVRKLIEETNRVTQLRPVCRVYNLGCGPAGEVQEFLARHQLSQKAEFTLVDSNEETLQFAARTLRSVASRNGRTTAIKLIKKSAIQLLKQSGKPIGTNDLFDFVYCAGLFDYLGDRVCKSLLTVLYQSLAPGGLLLVTNVEPGNPIRNIMEHIYEWYLIYRNQEQLMALTSDLPPEASASVQAELTSSNLFLEVRKPS
jgi:extracellular factor (EF) 3-hydroxypalmitic acid methyl ester biosynthesis protein